MKSNFVVQICQMLKGFSPKFLFLLSGNAFGKLTALVNVSDHP